MEKYFIELILVNYEENPVFIHSEGKFSFTVNEKFFHSLVKEKRIFFIVHKNKFNENIFPMKLASSEKNTLKNINQTTFFIYL